MSEHNPVTHEDIKQNLLEGGRRFDTIEATLVDISAKLEVLPEMQQKIDKTAGIVEAWDAAQGALKFFKGVGTVVRWAAGVAAGIGIIWAAAKAAAKGGFG